MEDTSLRGGGPIKLRNAVALYASSVLGSGILVLPGLTAVIAGPASILAWIFLSVASFPFAITFASLSTHRTNSVGIYSFTKEALGPHSATVSGWLFFLWVITGAPAVGLVAASYLGYVIHISRPEMFVAAIAIILCAFVVNYSGIVMSNRVQLAVIGSIIALLLVTILVSGFHVRLENFVPFFPGGIIPVGMSAALIFWSFLGYENVSNVAGEFQDPVRDFRKSVYISVILIGALYIAISFVTIGTLAYKRNGGTAPFAAILSDILGSYAGVATGIIAVFIIFGLVNAYTTGMSRVFYTAALDGVFPHVIAHLNGKNRAPDRALILMSGCMIPVFLIYFFFNINLETAFLISGGAAIFTYIIGFVSALKLVSADSKIVSIWMPTISLAVSLVLLLFVGVPLLVSIVVALCALIYSYYRIGRKPVT